MAASFLSASFLVGSSIHSSVLIRSLRASFKLLTSSSARAFACGGKSYATYSLPSASPIASSVEAITRFHRGLICCVPRRTRSLKLKSSSTKSFESSAAVASISCQRRYAFQSSIGVFLNTSSAALKNSGWCTLTLGGSSRLICLK